ncbi:unnamed protein product [Ixodes pacificus]
MADHFQLEMDKLADFYSCRRWVDRSHEEASLPEPQVQCRPSYDAGKRSPLSRWETYLKVRGNRHQRLNVETGFSHVALCGRRRRAELPLDLQSADGSPPGTPHGRGPPPPPPSLKVELSDNAYDHEGARGGGGGSKDPMLRSPATGSFSESGEQSRDRQTPGAPGHGSPVTGEGGQGCALAAEPGSEPCADDGTPSDLRSGTADETIRWKCVVCSEPYRTPLVSVCCWHVHCERCWLQTLGSKRLCPQCDAVTCPSDLRKIYL